MGKTLERLKQYIDFKQVSLRSFEREAGLSNGSFANQLKKQGTIGVDKLEHILRTYEDLNPTWVLTGEGSMLKADQEVDESLATEPTMRYLSQQPQGIPLIPATEIAEFEDGAMSIDERKIIERYQVPDFKDADFIIQVNGNSMQPKYSSGDLVACQMVIDRPLFQWGRVFVLHHKRQGIMIKRLFPTGDASEVVCKSDNTDYPDFTLNLNQITNIAIVLGAICID